MFILTGNGMHTGLFLMLASLANNEGTKNEPI